MEKSSRTLHGGTGWYVYPLGISLHYVLCSVDYLGRDVRPQCDLEKRNEPESKEYDHRD